MSEQYLVSDCYADYDCNGGWHDEAFNFTKYFGISDEQCFEYLESNSACNRCSDWESRTWTIDNYEGTWNHYIGSVQMKEWLVNYGPLAVALNVSAWNSNNYTCDSSSWVDHAVVIVGYNDTGEYWIARNSWGEGFGDNGYFNIKYNNCNINYFVFYVDTVNAPNYKPEITLNSPEENYSTSTTTIIFNTSISNKASTTSTCDLYINNTLHLTNSSVSNNTATIFSTDLSEGNYTWYTKCWENTIGIIQTSETRNFEVSNTAPSIISSVQ